MIHMSEDFYANDEGWWEARCSCGKLLGVFPSAEDGADALMQHAREIALLEDREVVS